MNENKPGHLRPYYFILYNNYCYYIINNLRDQNHFNHLK